jgi:hypothetical protein
MASAASRALLSGAPDAMNASYTCDIIIAMMLPQRSKIIIDGQRVQRQQDALAVFGHTII